MAVRLKRNKDKPTFAKKQYAADYLSITSPSDPTPF
jgi:hypothetical protein